MDKMAEQGCSKETAVKDDELDDLLEIDNDLPVVDDEELMKTSGLKHPASALGDFGKHVPKPKASEDKSDELFRHLFGDTSGVDMEQATKLMSELLPGGDDSGDFPPPEGLGALDDIFSEEFAKAAEAQMKEAFDLLSKENPELLEQFEQFAPELTGVAKTGSDSSGGEKRTSSPHPPCPPSQEKVTSSKASSCDASVNCSAKKQSGRSQGDSEIPGSGGEGRKEARSGVGEGRGHSGAGGGAGPPDLHSAVDEALKSMQQNAESVGKMSGPSDFSNFLPGMGGVGEGPGEDGLLAMMEQMMGQLLSKDILYPPLKDFCQQYPEWLQAHKEEVSESDYSRYAQQLNVMRRVCSEFEGEDLEETNEGEQTRFERILQFMHQLQQLGQPPPDLLKGMGRGVDLQPPALPNPDQCSVM